MRRSWWALVLALVFGLAGMARANEVLFPYFVTNPGTVSTIVTLINTSNSTCNPHLQYYYKDAGNNTAACNEIDFYQDLTGYDMVSFDVAAYFDNGAAMFDDTNSGSWSLTSVGLYRGFLYVNATCDMDGEAFLVNLTQGTGWGYRAIVDNGTDAKFYGTAMAFYENAAAAGVNTVDYYEEGQTPVSFWGIQGGTATSRLLVTPLGDNATNNPITAGNFTVSLHLSTDYGNGAYNRQEEHRSFTNSESITCVGAVDFFGGFIPTDAVLDTANPLSALANGGWAWLNIDTTNAGAIIYKLDFGAIVNGNSFEKAYPITSVR